MLDKLFINYEETVSVILFCIGFSTMLLNKNLIKKIIRTGAGGDRHYTTAGTNALWDSDGKRGRYRDLTWKQAGISGA